MTSREALILKMSARLGLDPQAVDAIGNVEGRNALHGGNSIGDNGSSFGPFQLHAGGALPAEVWARGATYANNWANSPAGIQYALQRMASVAGGTHGQAAVQAISSRFERPADVAGEVSKAMGFYGGSGTGAGSAQYSPQGAQGGSQGLTGVPGVNPYAAGLLQQISQGGQQNAGLALLNMAMQRQQAGAAQQTYGPQPTTGPLLQSGHGGAQFVGNTQGEKPHFLTALAAAGAAVGGTKIRVTSGYRSPQHNAAVGGVQGSNHTTGDAMDGDLFIPGRGWVPLGVALQGVAGKYGLRSGNVAGFFNGNPDPVHVDDGSNVH
jgi:hypothetical protein